MSDIVSSEIAQASKHTPSHRRVKADISQLEVPAESKELLNKIYTQSFAEATLPASYGDLSGFKTGSMPRCGECGNFAPGGFCFKCNRPIESRIAVEVPFGNWAGRMSLYVAASDREQWRWNIKLRIKVHNHGIDGESFASFAPIKFEDGCKYNHRCQIQYPYAESYKIITGPLGPFCVTICLPQFIGTEQIIEKRGSNTECVGARSVFVLGAFGKPMENYPIIYAGYPFLLAPVETTDEIIKAFQRLNEKIQKLISSITRKNTSGYISDGGEIIGLYSDGKITLYKGSGGDNADTLLHEVGHAVFGKILNKEQREEWYFEIWFKTKNLGSADGGPPTENGADNFAEDFAESFMMYCRDEAAKGELKIFNQRRYNFLVKILKDYPEEKVTELALHSLLPEKNYRIEGGLLRRSEAEFIDED